MSELGQENFSSPSFACCPTRRQAHKHDSGWAWVVGATGSLCTVLAIGCSYSFGVIYPSLLDEFKQGKAKTAWIGSLCMSLTFSFAPVAGKLCDRFSPRVVAILGGLVAIIGLVSTSQAHNIFVMYATYGVIFAFGASCVYIAVFVTVPKYFRKWRSLATGMLSSGPGTGTFLMSPILALSIEELGWRGAFFVMAGIMGVVCVLGCTFDPNTQKDALEGEFQESKQGENRRRKPSKNHEYLMTVSVTTLAILGIIVPQVHLARYCEERGISLNLASKLYLAFGLCSAFARVFAGRLCDLTAVNNRYFYQTCLYVSGMLTLLCPLAKTFPHLLIVFILFGLFDGAQATVATDVLIINCVHEEQLGQGLGIWLFFLSISIASGPPLAGYVADSTGSYAPAFFMAGGCIIAGASAYFMIYFVTNTPNDADITPEDQAEIFLVVEEVTVV